MPDPSLERTQRLTDAMLVAAHVLPSLEDLRVYIAACARDQAVGPILHPSEWMRANRRLDALKALAEAGVTYRLAFERFQQAVVEEGGQVQ